MKFLKKLKSWAAAIVQRVRKRLSQSQEAASFVNAVREPVGQAAASLWAIAIQKMRTYVPTLLHKVFDAAAAWIGIWVRTWVETFLRGLTPAAS